MAWIRPGGRLTLRVRISEQQLNSRPRPPACGTTQIALAPRSDCAGELQNCPIRYPESTTVDPRQLGHACPTATAAAWESTAKAVNAVLLTAQEFGEDEEGPATQVPEAEEEGPGALEVWGASAQETREAADEILVLLRELKSEEIGQLVERLEKSVREPIDHAADRADELLNRLTLRLYVAIGIVAALVIAYRALAHRRVRTS